MKKAVNFIELLNGEMVEREEVAKETFRRVYNEVEWHYEQTGEEADAWETYYTVNQEMQAEGWIEDSCAEFEDEAEAAFEEAIEDLKYSQKNSIGADPGAGRNYFDRQL